MRAVLTDVEGTTTSLSLVKDVLFPYARRHLAEFVQTHAADDAVKRVLDDVRSREADPAIGVGEVVALLVRWMDEDRKTTPLKTLQGMIWSEGYARGELQGHVYGDAVVRLRAWRSNGIALYVYSSGSVLAQKLLFAHTEFGDLTGLFAGFFDTTIGAKLDPRSYEAIARCTGHAPADTLFLSDSIAELDAARAAGLATTWVDRSGAPPVGSHPSVTTFADLPDY